jgi:hypothetical protein
VFKPSSLLGRACLIAGLAVSSSELTAQSGELPPAPIKQKVVNACTECHESRIIVQQRLSRAAWGKEVDKMVKWGALVDPRDRDAFIEYLSVNFPPDKPAEVMPRVVPQKAAAGSGHGQ